ncbi:SDR family NAD(P)-dependent oxidoreductase [Paenibacillus sp. FSL H3-0469]|uniref:SDR family NAD(P)-dependent oxidoreductase n=1 Tax=Paenibacillus sp. FSL H3-0469 TaxID=2954506 RepID=UPI003100DDE9
MSNNAIPGGERPLYLFLLSAKTREGLMRKLTELQVWIREEPDIRTDAGNIAYTLSIGRSHFSRRAALIAADLQELETELLLTLEKLTLKSGEASRELLRKQTAREDQIRLDAIALPGSAQGNTPALFSRQTLEQCAELYLEGGVCDWKSLYTNRPYFKIPLPAYPFEKQRYWLELNTGRTSPSPAPGQAQIHAIGPVLDCNRSTVHEQCFEKRLTGEEFYLKDHIVSGRKLLPGVVQLEMALSAAAASLPGASIRSITDVVWAYPVQLSDGEESKLVQVRLYPGGSQDELDYEIVSQSDGAEVVHSQGSIGYTQEAPYGPPESMDIARLCQGKTDVSGSRIYDRFREHQLELGPSFQSITRMSAGAADAVAFIELPAHLHEGFGAFTLHPTVTDGVLEAVIGLISGHGELEGAVALPYSFDKLEIFGSLPPNCVSYVTRLATGADDGDLAFDVAVSDVQGRVLLKFTRFVLRVFQQGRTQTMEEMSFVYEWKEREALLPAPDSVSGDIVWFAAEPELIKSLPQDSDGTAFHPGALYIVEAAAEYQQAGEAHYRMNPERPEDYVRLLRDLANRGCSLETLVYEQQEHSEETAPNAAEGVYLHQLYLAQALMAVRENRHSRVIQLCRSGEEFAVPPGQGALRGFNKTLKLEYSKLHFSMLYTGSAGRDGIYRMIAAEIRSTDDEVLYRQGTRYVHALKEIASPAKEAAEATKNILRPHGVYLLTGGLGKLGLIVAGHLARHYQAKLALVGRSALLPEQEREIARLQKLGAEVVYVQADLSQAEAAAAAVADARSRLGSLNGIIHAAGVTRDALIQVKDAGQASGVLGVKIQGLTQLDQATREDKLDFIAAFSSIAAVTGNVGQSDYAYANAWMDEYLLHRKTLVQSGHRHGRSISINWPFWQEGGLSVEEQTLLFFRNTVGLKPLETSAGLRLLEAILNGSEVQILPLLANRRKICGILGLESAASGTTTTIIQPGTGAEPAESRSAGLLEPVQQILTGAISRLMKLDAAAIHPDQDLGEYGMSSLTFTDAANAVNAAFQVRMTPAVFFEYPTIRALAAYLLESYADELVTYFSRGVAQAPEAAVDYGSVQASASGQKARQSWKPLQPETAGAGKPEPVAIIGISGAMPQSENLDAFWEHLRDQQDLITEIPADRWDAKELNRLKGGVMDKPVSGWGGFMQSADKFDPGFFSINPREADLMDPQQRIFLETVWSTLENAGYKASELSGRKVGLFVGVSTNDYSTLLQDNDIEIEAYSSTGSSHCVLANRISYLLNFRGPSEPVDTACSSSLVAVHRAVESIRSGDCEQAIAGGVNVIAAPTLHISFSRAGMLSPDGRCKTFDQSADGYVRGEGTGAVLLKPLSQAEADGDYIYAVIRGTAVNHGGKVSSLTVPNPKAQAEVLVEAYEKADIPPDTISYIEAHGTGTSLGDPVEINALKNAFKELHHRRGIPLTREQYCGIGAVKSNIGHLEAAAGIAGILKVVLAMKNRTLPGNVHFKQLNPYIELAKSPFYIVEQTQEWTPPDGLPRRAGISSFGFGGVNAHVVMEDYPSRDTVSSVTRSMLSGQGNVIVLSAKSADRLQEKARQLLNYLTLHAADEELTLHNIAYTLQTGREEMAERIAFTAVSKEELIDILRSYAAMPEQAHKVHYGRVPVQLPAPSSSTANSGKPVGTLKLTELSELAEQWTAGKAVDWSRLYADRECRRIPLPAYPFARETCWVHKNSRRIAPKLSSSAEASAVLHPMVDSNVSTMEEEKFRTVLRPEQFYVKDHVVGGKVLLPGVAYLELVRAAAVLAGINPVTGLRNVKWIKAVEMEEKQKEIFTTFAHVDQGEVEYKVFSEAEGQRTLHSTGRIMQKTPAPAQTLEIAKIKERSTSSLTQAECYDHIFKEVGFDYGPAFRVTKTAYCSLEEGLSEISLPEHLDEKYAEYVLHPSIIDGAVRSLSWTGNRSEEDLTLRVPYALDRIELIGKVPPQCYAYAKPAEGASGTDDEGTRKYDIHITDRQGLEAARLFGFSIKQYAAAAVTASALTLYSPEWIETELPQVTAPLSSIVVFGSAALAEAVRRQAVQHELAAECCIQVEAGAEYARLSQAAYVIRPEQAADYLRLLESLRDQGVQLQHIVHGWNWKEQAGAEGPDLEEQQESLGKQMDQGLYSLLYLLQAAAAVKPRSRIRCLYAYSRAADMLEPLHEMNAGFAHSLAADHPLFQLSLVNLESSPPVQAAGRLIRELLPPQLAGGTEIRYAGDVRSVRKLLPQPLLHQAEASRFTQGGVYVLTGGTGALGMRVAAELASAWQARLVLAGRQAQDSAIQAKLEQLTGLGAEAVYVQADVADPEDAARIIGAAKSHFGRINGILHCAGTGTVTKAAGSSKADFAGILAPKVDGTLNLDHASKNEALDLFILFSSTSAQIGDMGAGSYAAANAFMDRYAVYRDWLAVQGRRQGKTVSVNWPLWKDGSYLLPAAQQQVLAGYYGMQPLDSRTGLHILETVLKEDAVQAFVGYGDSRKISRALGVAEAPLANQEGEALQPTGISANNMDSRALLEGTQTYLVSLLARTLGVARERIGPTSPLDAFGLDSIMILELNESLEREFSGLPTTLFYEYNTVEALAGYFTGHYGAQLVTLLKLEQPHGNDAPIAAVQMPGDPQEADLTASQSRRFIPKAGEDVSSVKNAGNPGVMDIAVIGMDGRFPMAGNIAELWDNLKEGKDCITEIPENRWDYTRDYDAEKGKKGKIYTKYGGFIDDVDKFDPLFFQMTPRDAQLTDPQERLFLECAYHTVEDAGYTRERLARSKVGVFVGVMYGHYQLLGTEGYTSGQLAAPNSSFASIANRVSWLFNFQGPSMAVDTMCSSSLTAIHLACESIRSGESEAALAGGVNVTIHRNKYVFLCSQRFASSEGKCRAFGEGGDGYVASEGVGAVLLKPLSKAIEDGDHIYGVIKGTAVNSGGKTSGYTVPNPGAQAAAIAEALRKSGVHPRTITSLEAHGTGTPLGDPIEIAGLSRAFSQYTDDKQFCSISSVKSNIGHLESAAGIASLAKVMLQMKHRMLVPSIHTEELNSGITFEDTPFYVQRSLEHWEHDSGSRSMRRAGVSSFGAGGSNVHLIAEEYVPVRAAAESAGRRLIVLSAKNRDRLSGKISELHRFLDMPLATEYTLANIAYTLSTGREEMEERLAVAVQTVDELKQVMKSLATGAVCEGIYRGNTTAAAENGTAILGNDPEDTAYIAALARRNQLDRIGKLWVLGTAVDWNLLFADTQLQKVSLPLYPFARESYWLENTGGGFFGGSGHKETSGTAHGLGPAAAGGRLPGTINSLQPLHPLVDINISTLREQRFRKRLSVDQFYLRDHIVADQILLPGVAYIEMARAAGEIAGEAGVRAVRNVVWLKPVVMTEEFKELDIVLEPEGEAVHYEIFSQIMSERVVHSRGILEFAEGPAAAVSLNFDLKEIRNRCPGRKDKQECYQQIFKAIGFSYGPSFQVTEEVLSGKEETLARLSLNEAYRSGLPEYVLHPALLDGAVRSVAAGREEEGRATHIPFSLGSIEIFAPIPADCYVYTRVKEQPGENNLGLNIFDISILDLHGQEVVRIGDFIVRPYTVKPEGNPAAELHYYTPVYEHEALVPVRGAAQRKVLILGYGGMNSGRNTAASPSGSLPGGAGACIWIRPDTEYRSGPGDQISIHPHREADYVRLLEKLRERDFHPTHVLHQWAGTAEPLSLAALQAERVQPILTQMLEDGIFSVISLFKAFVHVFGQQPLKLLFAYPQEQGGFSVPHELLASFAKSIVTLHHKFQITSVAADYSAIHAADYQERLYQELFSQQNPGHLDVRYAGELRTVRRIRPLTPGEGNTAASAPLVIKEKGIYLIPGGTGALGMIVGGYLARTCGATLICTGRQPASERTDACMAELRRLGGDGRYLQGDIAIAGDVLRMMDSIRNEFGLLNGIIHCAGQGSTLPVTESAGISGRELMSSKVEGLIYLDLFSTAFELDFLMLFSSIAVELGDLGVGYYAMANSFMDRYARLRNEAVTLGQRKGRTISVNWPLWKDGGFGIPESEAVYYSTYLGMSMLEEESGIRALEAIFQADCGNIIVAAGNKSKIDQALKLNHSIPVQEVPLEDKEAIVDLLTRLQTGEMSEAEVKQWMGGL